MSEKIGRSGHGRSARPPGRRSRKHHDIVSLGIFREPGQLAVLMVAVALLVVQAFVINRLAGIAYPAWSPAPPGT
jgi:hypothetical protein